MEDSAARKLENFDAEEDPTRELLEKEYQVDTTDIKNSEGLTYVILEDVARQRYNKAIRALKAYADYKANFPTYKPQTDRIFEHIENVIRAIKAKKGLGSAPNISASKRKELQNAVVFHFQDLKQSLQNVTQIEYQIRIRDSRSTLWVLHALVICVFLVMAVALVREGWFALRVPMDVFSDDIVNFAMKFIKF
jgi:hypothetical protein